MNIGDIAATQHPVNRPNKLAQRINEDKEVHMVNRNKGGNTRVMESAEKVRG